MKVTVIRIQNEEGAKSMERPMGTYITMELPDLLEEEERLKEIAELELSRQLKELLQGKKAEHILVVGLGNREVTADAVGPLTVDSLLVTRHYFQEETMGNRIGKKYRKVSAFTPGVMAQTGMETMELIRGVVEQIKPDIVVAVDALAARSPKRLNTTIQLTDTGISPGAGVGNNRKELNETSLGCPVIAIGVPTVLDAVTIAREDVSEDVQAFFVMPRNIDSSVQYVSELLAGGINRVNQKNRI
jgi:spore protease